MKNFNIVSKISLPFIKHGKDIIRIVTKSNDEQEKKRETEARLKSLYDIAIQTRNFEITQLVQRNNFFMIFQGVLFACIIYSSNTVPLVHLMLCIVGMYISYSQTKVAAGAKYWQEFWENKVTEVEKMLSEFYKNSKPCDNSSLEFHPFFTTPSKIVRSKVLYQCDKKKTLVNQALFSKKSKKAILIKINNKINNLNKEISEIKEKNLKEGVIFSNTKPIKRLDYHADKYRFIKLYFTINLYLKEIYRFFSIFGIVLDKPSVSKIPIRVGRALFIIWMILATSTVTPVNHWLKTLNSIKGFPTHEDAAKHEITNNKPIKLEIIKE